MTMAFITTNELEEKYERLKELIIDHIENAFPREDYITYLNKLKDDFAKDVKSVRQLDAADSVAGLIRLLEKRLLIGWFRVDPFIKILEEYEMDGDSRDRYIEYVTVLEKYKLRNGKAFSTYPYDADILRDVPTNSDVIPRHISEYICMEMKNNWLEFGRELVSEGLAREGQLDKLIDSDIPTEEKTQQLLDIFVKGDKRTKRSQLSRLLKLVNTTLGEEVDEKFMNHHPDLQCPYYNCL